MEQSKLTMKLLEEKYGVAKLDKDSLIPNWAIAGEFYSICKTEDELSIVCLQDNIPKSVKYENGWRVLKV
ncbi:MAG: ACT domain-containing protein, partial [Clostridium sp.]